MKRQLSVVIILSISIFIAGGIYLSFAPISDAQDISQADVEVGTIEPNDPREIEAATVIELSPREIQQRELLFLRKLELRERINSFVDNNPPSPSGLPLVSGYETQIIEPIELEFHGDPSLLVIGRNNKNTNANNTTKGSTLAEPAAANNAIKVFSAGNYNHAEHSSDGGVTWTDVVLPGGPTDAPSLCCDHDVVIDDARRVTFHSTLYTNSLTTNGVVRIFVRRDPPAAACSYDIDPGGTANNVLPDFPHIGLTKRYLYLTMNAIQSVSGYARIYRFNIDQMSDCVTVSYSTYTQPFSTYGQRVWIPAEGTNNIETMYWGQLDNTTTFRIFSWSESATLPTSAARTISASTFSNPDCRGGTGNYDFIQRSTAWSITGFTLHGAAAPGANGGSGAVAFYWTVGADTAHTQGHIHAAVFRMIDLALIAQPHIFNSSNCFGYPTVTANKRGDFGISLAWGGKAGGGGTAAQGAIGVDDEFTTGIGYFAAVSTTATGTHNRSDGRFGDYFTIHPYEPCEKWFTATNYALNGGNALANVNSRYVEFGRNQSYRCYKAHKDQQPVP